MFWIDFTLAFDDWQLGVGLSIPTGHRKQYHAFIHVLCASVTVYWVPRRPDYARWQGIKLNVR